MSQNSYDFDQCSLWRSQAVGWEVIAKRFGYSDHSGVRKRYIRDLKKYGDTIDRSRAPVKRQKRHISDEIEIDILGKYGTVAITGYISDLNNDDWIEYYTGFNWKAEYLTEMRDKIWFTQKLLLLTFRFGGKTTTMSCLFLRWILEVHEPIVCFGNPEKIGDIFYLITELLESDLIRRDYGDVVARRSGYKIWLVAAMRVSRDGSPMTDPNLSMSGKLATTVGKHTGDYGWLHLEDLWQDIAVSSEAERRIRKWLDRTIRYMKGRNTKFTMTGTRKDLMDAYQYAMDKLYFPVLKQVALQIVSGRLPNIDECEVDHERDMITKFPDVGKYIIQDCPRWELPYLLYEFLFHYEDAESELNNNPLPAMGRYFNGDDWIEVDKLPDAPNYMIVDPAFGQSNTSSKTAIIVVSVGAGKMTMIDAFIGRLGRTDKADMIVDFHQRHHPFQTLIEDNFRQITSRYDQNHALMKLRGLSMIDNFENKRDRIEALKFSFRKHEIQIYNNCPFKSEIKAEYLSYKQDDSDAVVKVRYNALDSLSMGYLRLKHFMATVIQKMRIGSIGRRWQR